MHPMRIAALALPAGILATTLVACSDSTSPSAGRTLTLSFSANATAPAASLRRVRLAPQVVASAAGDTLVITKAQLVLREVELTSSLAASCDGPGDDDCREAEVGPLLVDLPVDGLVTSPISVALPAGSYSKLEFELHKPESSNDSADDSADDSSDDSRDSTFLAAHPEFAGVSVRVEGTINGQPFVYTSSVNAEMELEFDTPVVIDATTTNVTVNADVSRWFRSSTGDVLAPNSSNAGLIDENIKASFEAFEDDDRDGSDDRSGDGGDDR
jgi:hypothetical protein